MKDLKKLSALLLDLVALVLILTTGFAVATNLLATLARNAQVYTTNKENGSFQHIDFISYYMAGTLAREDEKTRKQAYDPAVQMSFYNKAIAPAKIDRPIYFNYPPYAFPLMTLFSWLPLRSAYLAWNALSLIAAAIALFMAGKAAGKLSNFALCGIIAMFVLSFPGCDALMDGQTTWWFVALIALSYWGLKTNRNVVAGIATGLLAFKPHYFLFMVIPLLVSRKRAAVLGAIGTLALLITIGALTLGFENVINYPKIVLAGENPELCPMTFPERMVCLRGPASIFLSHDWYMRLAFLSFAAGLISVALVFKKVWNKDKATTLPPLEWAYALTIPLVLTLSPHMHIYDCALLAIPACLLLSDIRPSKIWQQKNFAFKMASYMLLSYMLVSWLMMVVPPEAGKLLPLAWQDKLSINNIVCALLSFHTYLVFDIILILLLLVSPAAKNQAEA